MSKQEKAAANPKGLMPRHKALAMGMKIETGAKQKPKAKKK